MPKQSFQSLPVTIETIPIRVFCRPERPLLQPIELEFPRPGIWRRVDHGYLALFDQAKERLASLGHTLIEVDIEAFLQTAQLLYGGPWIAERFAAVGRFVKEHPEAVHPVVRDIILGGEKYSAVDAFSGQYALEKFRQETADTWKVIDFLLLPTAPDIFRITEVESDPIALNSRLGLFTNFFNLLDLAGVAVPAGFRPDGLPFGDNIRQARLSPTGPCSRSLPRTCFLCVPASAEQDSPILTRPWPSRKSHPIE